MSKLLYFLCYHASIYIHYTVVVGMLYALLASLVTLPWWHALVIWAVVIRIGTSPNLCPISMVENYFARQLGIPEKPLFIKHHVVPLVKSLNKRLGAYYAKHLRKH